MEQERRDHELALRLATENNSSVDDIQVRMTASWHFYSIRKRQIWVFFYSGKVSLIQKELSKKIYPQISDMKISAVVAELSKTLCRSSQML